MTYKVTCLTCKKPVDKMSTERNVYRRSTEIHVWCHGKHATLEVTYAMDVNSNDSTIQLNAFPRPALIIEDRDRGDEDPNEPWEGKSCQF